MLRYFDCKCVWPQRRAIFPPFLDLWTAKSGLTSCLFCTFWITSPQRRGFVSTWVSARCNLQNRISEAWVGLEETCSARLDTSTWCSHRCFFVCRWIAMRFKKWSEHVKKHTCQNRLSEQQAPHVFHLVALLAFLAAVILARWTFWPVSWLDCPYNSTAFNKGTCTGCDPAALLCFFNCPYCRKLDF